MSGCKIVFPCFLDDSKTTAINCYVQDHNHPNQSTGFVESTVSITPVKP